MKCRYKPTVNCSIQRKCVKSAAFAPIFLSILLLGACSSGSSDSSANAPDATGTTTGTGATAGIAGVGATAGTTGTGVTAGTTGDAGTTAGTGATAGATAGAISGTPDPSATTDGVSAIPDNQIPDNQESESPEIGSDQTSFFFSYDESASTASRDLALTALANGRKPDPELGRPYEFLNAEQIGHSAGEMVGPFNVSMGLLRSESDEIPLELTPEGIVYGLGVHISGPTQTLQDRRNVVLTVLLDISGSMDSDYALETSSNASTLLDVAKVGLRNMQKSLKQGDVVNLVTFATDANVLLEAHSPTANSLDSVIDGIFTTSSTDIDNGLNLAYEVANRTYDVNKANRVVIITDAYVNTGVIDPTKIASQTVINGLEGIHFSGVGVGSDFNDGVLNTITDAGKGSYSAMITPADAQRIFTDGFSRFMNPAARDVRFQLTYPQEMDQLKSYAEEISTVASEVQTINFSYNSDQFFLELFSGPSVLSTDQELRLDITYEDDANQPQSVSLSKGVDTILGQQVDEIKAAAAVATLAQLINGSLSCNKVLASQLYNMPVQHEVYVSYRPTLKTQVSPQWLASDGQPLC